MIKRPSSRAINQQPPSPAETEQPVSDKRSEIERFKRQSRSFSLSLQGLSRKATYKADAREYTDIDWVPLPLAATTAEFNETTPPLVQSHATLARLRSGAGENKAREKKAAKEMLAAREQIYLNWLGQYAYFYVGPPRYEPLPAMIGVWVMMNERDEQLRWLAGYKTTDQAERSVLEEFSTEHLGTGVKAWTVTASAGSPGRPIRSRSLGAPGKQDLVDAAGQPVEVGSLANVRIPTGGRVGHPAIFAPHQVRAHDHAAVLVLESLGGVDAPDLAEPGALDGPQDGRRDAVDRLVRLEVPRTAPGADDDIVPDETESGRTPSGTAQSYEEPSGSPPPAYPAQRPIRGASTWQLPIREFTRTPRPYPSPLT